MNPVTSELTGETIDSSSEDWRHECECRSILAMQSALERNNHLDKIHRRRGPDAAYRLKIDVAVLFLLRQEPERWPAYVESFTNSSGPGFANDALKKATAILKARSG